MAEDDLRGLRILIVEDMFLVATDLAESLEELGCEVVGPVARLDEGLKHAGEAVLDGALLDVNLGNGTTSFPIAKALTERGVPFVFLSGYDAESGYPPGFENAARLSKPIDPRSLAGTMADAFVHRRAAIGRPAGR